MNDKIFAAIQLTKIISEGRGWTIQKAAIAVARILKLDNDEWRELITSL